MQKSRKYKEIYILNIKEASFKVKRREQVNIFMTYFYISPGVLNFSGDSYFVGEFKEDYINGIGTLF